MILRPRSYITFTKANGQSVSFDFCHMWETNESVESLTDTATIIIPRKLSQKGLNLFAGSNPIFERGDGVKIEAGYHPDKRTIFEGFISKVSANIPVEIKCEDYMYIFKQYSITYPKKRQIRTLSKKGKPLKHPKVTSENITLSGLISNIFHEGEYNDLLDGITYQLIDDVQLGQFRVTNATPAMVFEKLRDSFGLYARMKGKVLTISLANDASSTVEAEYKMEKVVINSNQLDYQTEDQIRIRARVISIMPDNSRIEAEAGEPDGAVRTYHYFNIKSESDLKKIAEKKVSEYKYSGFRGFIHTFGEPYLRPGDRAKITSAKLPERDGTYLVNGVRRYFSVNEGYKQDLELGVKVGK